MDTQVPEGPNARFKTRDVAQSAFLCETAAVLAANAADLALLIDKRGIVRDAALAGEEMADVEFDHWLGTKWTDLVHADSQEKVKELLGTAGRDGERRWRHINHAQRGEPDLPVRFFTVPAGKPGWTLAVGRDLRGLSRMQQRLIDAQRTMERDYAAVRETETRFRLLFQLASEGVLIIDGETLKVTDVNPAAAQLLGRSSQRLEGRSIDFVFGDSAAHAVRDALTVARKTGRTEQMDLSVEEGDTTCLFRASVYRQGKQMFFLVRLSNAGPSPAGRAEPSLSHLAEILPDGLVVTTAAAKILAVNEAFVDIVQLGSADAAVGAPFDRYFGRTETDLNVLIANLREHGIIRNFSTMVRTQYDVREPVEVSAVSAPGPTGSVFGFSIRPVGRRLVAGRHNEGGALPSSVDQLSDLVGRVALKDIVRESTDMIERNCIEAALELTNDNRASAAEMLGLSRQSLYAKMHRHNIGALQRKSDR